MNFFADIHQKDGKWAYKITNMGSTAIVAEQWRFASKDAAKRTAQLIIKNDTNAQ